MARRTRLAPHLAVEDLGGLPEHAGSGRAQPLKEGNPKVSGRWRSGRNRRAVAAQLQIRPLNRAATQR